MRLYVVELGELDDFTHNTQMQVKKKNKEEIRARSIPKAKKKRYDSRMPTSQMTSLQRGLNARVELSCDATAKKSRAIATATVV